MRSAPRRCASVVARRRPPRRARSTRCSPSRGARPTPPPARSISRRSRARSTTAEVERAGRSCRAPRATPRSCAGRWRRCSRTRTATRAAGSSSMLSASGGRVRVAVRDDGPGVRPDAGRARVRPGRARRRRSTTAAPGSGSPLARRLARSCGGDVTLGAGPGGCFVLELPAIEPRRLTAARRGLGVGGPALTQRPTFGARVRLYFLKGGSAGPSRIGGGGGRCTDAAAFRTSRAGARRRP